MLKNYRLTLVYLILSLGTHFLFRAMNLKGSMTVLIIASIAFAVFTSEYITHDEEDEVVDRVLFEWDNPEIGFPLTIDNLRKWKLLLESGEDTFDLSELKQNKKNNG